MHLQVARAMSLWETDFDGAQWTTYDALNNHRGRKKITLNATISRRSFPRNSCQRLKNRQGSRGGIDLIFGRIDHIRQARRAQGVRALLKMNMPGKMLLQIGFTL
jgi:hypothetical protein